MSASISSSARAVRLEHDQHVRHRVRHRVLGPLGAAGAAHHVLDLGNLAQDVLDPVIQPVDLVERGLGGSTVCSRNAPSSSCGMKSLPMRSPRASAGTATRSVPMPRRPVAQAAVEQPARTALDRPKQRDVLVAPVGGGPQDEGGGDRDQGQRQHERRAAMAAMTAAASG